MDPLVGAAVVLALVIFFLGSGIWVFAGLLLVAVSSLFLIQDMEFYQIGLIASKIMWRSVSGWELSAIPMFVWMGEIIFRTDISDRLFKGLSVLVDKLPGRLLHANVMGCTLFAAISGSSAATTATVGKITTTELNKRGYDTNLSIGSLAGAGSLGFLIPPSIIMIIYGILAETSIARLFAAGIFPGLLIASLYSGYIMIISIVKPSVAPSTGETLTFLQRVRGVWNLYPIFILMGIVLGAIYSGIATPSEAAAVGVSAALLLTIITRQLTKKIFVESLMSSIKVSAMVCSILMCASVLSTAMGYVHIPAELANYIASFKLSPYALILILSFFYIVLGFFLEGISIIVMSLPITLPMIIQAGFDPVWFGIYLVLMVELAQITPPVGFNLFVIQGLTGHQIGRIALAALPFFLLMCMGVIILTAFPGITLWLPGLLFDLPK